jgi:mRNA-degrading endonuclease toxin of MazEF toxin-antitoxin module
VEKNFDDWNKIKKRINRKTFKTLYNEREVRWCSLGLNIGFEEDGSNAGYRRPVLILKGMSSRTCLIIPLTTSNHQHPLRVSIGLIDNKLAHALLSQIKVIGTERLVRKIQRLDIVTFQKIRKTVKDML